MELHFTFTITIYLLFIFIIHYIIQINKNLSDNNTTPESLGEPDGPVLPEIDDMIISTEDIKQLDNNIVDFNNDEFNEQNAKDELLKYLNKESHKKPALIYSETKKGGCEKNLPNEKKESGLLDISAYDDLDYQYASFQD